MIKIGSLVDVYFDNFARHQLTVVYEPQQPMDVWILKDKEGKEYKIMHYNMICESE
jgi:hypothetical protein